MGNWADHVHPHGPLEQLAPRLWRVRGIAPMIQMPRNMVIWRDDEGGLVLHSVVAVDVPTLAAVEALGTPRVMIVPSGGHRLDVAVYKERWPDVVVTCPQAARGPVEKVVRVDGSSEELLPPRHIVVHRPPGLRPIELVEEVDAGDGHRALIFNDQIFHMEHRPGFHGFMTRYVTRSSGFFGISGLGRLLLLQDRGKFARWLRELADRTDVSVVTMSHGEPVIGAAACREKLRAAADRLGT